MGVCASAGHRKVGDRAFEAAKEYAENLGMAFQIQDDILDVTATTRPWESRVGSDAANRKTTFVTLLGVPACRDLVREHTQRAKAALDGVFPDSGFCAGWQTG